MATPVKLGRSALIRANLTVSKGADNDYWFRYGSEADPIDITGWTAASQIRSSVGGTVYANMAITLGGADGTILIHLDRTVTEAWSDSFVSGVWDLELTDDSGEVVRFAQGLVTVSPDVTRAV
jgi:hypothetical protein